MVIYYSLRQHFVAGMMGGVYSCPMCAPVERVKCVMQVCEYYIVYHVKYLLAGSTLLFISHCCHRAEMMCVLSSSCNPKWYNIIVCMYQLV